MSSIHEQVEKRFKKLGKRFNNIPTGFDIEDIHEFRLEIKKLRALLRLVSITHPAHHQLNIPRNLKSFYTSVGEIRNLQLHKKRIISLAEELNLETPSSYLQLITAEEDAKKEEARRLATLVDLSSIEVTMINHLPEKMKGAWLKKYLVKKKEELGLLLTSTFADENLHSVRKVLKDLIYNDNYIAPYSLIILPGYLTQTGNSNELAVWLGDFQDLCMALDLLGHRYLDQVTDETENKNLQIIRLHLEKEKKKLKSRISIVLVGLCQQMEYEGK